MKISYDREVDVLTLEISDGDIDHAEEAGPMIGGGTNGKGNALVSK